MALHSNAVFYTRGKSLLRYNTIGGMDCVAVTVEGLYTILHLEHRQFLVTKEWWSHEHDSSVFESCEAFLSR